MKRFRGLIEVEFWAKDKAAARNTTEVSAHMVNVYFDGTDLRASPLDVVEVVDEYKETKDLAAALTTPRTGLD